MTGADVAHRVLGRDNEDSCGMAGGGNGKDKESEEYKMKCHAGERQPDDCKRVGACPCVGPAGRETERRTPPS